MRIGERDARTLELRPAVIERLAIGIGAGAAIQPDDFTGIDVRVVSGVGDGRHALRAEPDIEIERLRFTIKKIEERVTDRLRAVDRQRVRAARDVVEIRVGGNRRDFQLRLTESRRSSAIPTASITGEMKVRIIAVRSVE